MHGTPHMCPLLEIFREISLLVADESRHPTQCLNYNFSSSVCVLLYMSYYDKYNSKFLPG